MKIIHKAFSVFLLLVFLLVPARAAHASGLQDGRIIFGDDFTLEKGDTLDGDLAVFGGNVLIEAGAVVEGSLAVIGGNAEIASGASINGDVAIIGGSLQIDGTVNGDLAVVGGEISLGEHSLVDGNIGTIGGELDQTPGAVITGVVEDNPSPSISVPDVPEVPDVPAVPAVPRVPNIPNPEIDFGGGPFWSFGNLLFQAAGMALVAMLAALFLQPQLERVNQAILGQPILAGGFGLLIGVGAPVALLILTVLTLLILTPVTFVGFLVLALAWLFGLAAIGQEIGERFTRAIHQTWAPPLTAAFGSFMLILVGGSFNLLVPCVGALVPILIGLVGLGGTALTLFGTRVYPRVALAPVQVPPADQV